MNEFTVHMANHTGRLAALAKRLGDAGVNIETLSTYTVGPDSYVRLLVDDEEAARRALHDAAIEYEERRILSTIIPNRPGALAEMTEELAAAGVSIDSMYLMHTSAEGLHFAVGVDDGEAAEAVVSPG